VPAPEHEDLRSEDDRFIDALDRVTWRVARTLMVGIPALVLLMLLIPSALPIGPMPSFVLALVGAAAATWAVEHRVGRHRRPPPGARGGWRLRRPGYGTLLVVGGVLVFVFYAIVISALGGSGG
jgi:hypothetical protein